MFFLILLMTAALSIAGSAAFFSVFGLANTFHGTFWAVVVMGSALEFGKLMATSFLYRYWNVVNGLLKSILTVLVISLMILTSTGIFGFLSTGYQTDAISFKQIEQRVSLLEKEKTRLIERKQQIDNQIASLPADTAKGRINLIKGFKDEQNQVTNRISILEAEELEAKTKLIQSEAHVGPVAYIAKALHLDTDDATKYLIYLIIFIFDPMAVALTLAVNVVMYERQKQSKDIIQIDGETMSTPDHTESIVTENVADVQTIPTDNYIEPKLVEVHDIEEFEPIIETEIETINEPELIIESELVEESTIEESTIEEQIIEEPIITNESRSFDSLEDLVNRYHAFKARIDNGEQLSLEDHWVYTSTRDKLQSQGFNVYI